MSDCVLGFISDRQHSVKSPNHTLAGFLDIESAFDRVSVGTAISCLHSLGLTGPVLSFLAHYQVYISSALKLNSSLSSPRTL